MSNSNAILPFGTANLSDLLEAIGITQFPDGTSWYQTIGGLLIQGGQTGSVATATTVDFHAGYTKQVLGVFITSLTNHGPDAYVSTVALDSFVINHSGGGSHNYYWFAIGV